MFGFHVIRQCEQDIVFRWGRLQARVRHRVLAAISQHANCRRTYPGPGGHRGRQRDPDRRPFPVELLRFFDGAARPESADAIVQAAQCLLAIQPDHGL
jgi:hypothetical protein